MSNIPLSQSMKSTIRKPTQRFLVLPVDTDDNQSCSGIDSNPPASFHPSQDSESVVNSDTSDFYWWKKMNFRWSHSRACWFRRLQSSFLVSSKPTLFRKLMKYQLGGYEEERRRHLESYPSSIHPYSDFRWTWDLFMTFILILTLICQPIQIAFYSDSIAHPSSVVINSVTCLIFFIDILLNFRTGYNGRDSDIVTLDPKRIARHYLRTWFSVDFISTIPFDLIYMAIEDVYPAARLYFKFFRLLELLKILRLARVIRILTKIQQALAIQPTQRRLLNLVIMMFFVLHWLGCMHYLVADLTHGREAKSKGQNLSWVSEMDLWEHPIWEKYLHCVLRALSNMGCLGYGYVAPLSPEDVVCTIICILIGATWFALFIANVSNIVLNLDASHNKYDETLNQMLQYIKFKHIPKDLQTRVENYFEQRYHHNFFNEDEILGNLSPVLRTQLQLFNCQYLIERVSIFQGLPIEVIHEIVGSLRAEVFLPRDVIIWENTIGHSMYFIQRGSVEVLTTSGRVINHLFDGNFFGEMALLTHERRRVASIIATTRCEIYSLSRINFETISEMCPEVFNRILLNAKDRARQINIQQTDYSTSAEERVRDPPQPVIRPSIHETFHLNSKFSDSLAGNLNFRSLERRRRVSTRQPLLKTLDEILKMKLKKCEASHSKIELKPRPKKTLHSPVTECYCRSDSSNSAEPIGNELNPFLHPF